MESNQTTRTRQSSTGSISDRIKSLQSAQKESASGKPNNIIAPSKKKSGVSARIAALQQSNAFPIIQPLAGSTARVPLHTPSYPKQSHDYTTTSSCENNVLESQLEDNVSAFIINSRLSWEWEKEQKPKCLPPLNTISFSTE